MNRREHPLQNDDYRFEIKIIYWISNIIGLIAQWPTAVVECCCGFSSVELKLYWRLTRIDFLASNGNSNGNRLLLIPGHKGRIDLQIGRKSAFKIWSGWSVCVLTFDIGCKLKLLNWFEQNGSVNILRPFPNPLNNPRKTLSTMWSKVWTTNEKHIAMIIMMSFVAPIRSKLVVQICSLDAFFS